MFRVKYLKDDWNDFDKIIFLKIIFILLFSTPSFIFVQIIFFIKLIKIPNIVTNKNRIFYSHFIFNTWRWLKWIYLKVNTSYYLLFVCFFFREIKNHIYNYLSMVIFGSCRSIIDFYVVIMLYQNWFLHYSIQKA